MFSEIVCKVMEYFEKNKSKIFVCVCVKILKVSIYCHTLERKYTFILLRKVFNEDNISRIHISEEVIYVTTLQSTNRIFRKLILNIINFMDKGEKNRYLQEEAR